MILRPPDLTRTATPFPYPSPFRSVDGLTGPADIAGDIRWADDSADDIRHHHRLRPADVAPAAVVKPCLQAFVEPAEARKPCDDGLLGAPATPTIPPVADGASAPQLGRAHVLTPVTNAPLVCHLLLDNNTHQHSVRMREA